MPLLKSKLYLKDKCNKHVNYTYIYRKSINMESKNKRKEVVLDEETLAILEEKAKSEGRNLKNYMEFVLREDAYSFEPSQEYKSMMDAMIENHKSGKTNYTSWEDVKKELF